jgi:hypothetical protein
MSECSDNPKKKRKTVALDAKSQIREQGVDLVKSIDEIKTQMYVVPLYPPFQLLTMVALESTSVY